MPLKSQVVTAFEFGTSKITILVGEINENELRFLYSCSMPSDGTVVKGEIVDRVRLQNMLGEMINTVNKATSDAIYDSIASTVVVTGCDIKTHDGVGNIAIRDGEVTQADVLRAGEEAKPDMTPESYKLGCYYTSFMLDGNSCHEVVGRQGKRLEAHFIFCYGNANRLDTFSQMLTRFDIPQERIFRCFAPVADELCLLDESEQNSGALLIDLGAGCTEYLLERDARPHALGVHKVGFEHVANDLSIAFGMSPATCRKILADGTLDMVLTQNHREVTLRNQFNSEIKIPVGDIQTVVDARLRETFGIIKNEIEERHESVSGCTGVLTGGGAKLQRAVELFSEVFGINGYMRKPGDITGNVTSLLTPESSAVCGALKYSYMKAVSQLKNKHKRGLFGLFGGK